MKAVQAKKHLGQHFLNDENIAENITQALLRHYQSGVILEVGPGMGVLTKYLLAAQSDSIFVSEIDSESVTYLQAKYLDLSPRIIREDFLRINFTQLFSNKNINIIGNFPYNISSQIVFKVLDNYKQIPIMCGMFQKEVAERIGAKPHSKAYGILSVLTQAFYDVEYLFTVPAHVFTPPPQVQSGVVRLILKTEFPDCDLKLFKEIIKTAFNQRRKKMRNALSIYFQDRTQSFPFEDLRAENLSVENFVELTNYIAKFKHK